MSALRGSLSPPPPNNGNPFEHLPAELLLMIYQYTGLDTFMNVALAIYPTLQRHNLAPQLSAATLVRILNEPNGSPIAPANASAVSRMPVELWLQVAGYLEPADTISLIFAVGSWFYWFSEEPSRETRDRLRIWSRRSRKK